MKDITLMKPFMYLFIMFTIYNPVFSKTNSTMSNGQFFQYKYLDGLSSNFIFDIEKDESGRIWVATQNGLTVIGGQNFIKYSVNDSLPSSDIIDITFFNDEVYVATSTDGIFTFNGDYFERVFNSSESLASPSIDFNTNLDLGKLDKVSSNLYKLIYLK